MAQASEGKRKTKAKVVSPARTQAHNQPVRESPSPVRSAEREPMNVSHPPSPAQPDPDGLATGPTNGADLAPYNSEPQTGEGEGEQTGETHGADIHRRIAERAFHYYAEDGFQHGHDLDHWLEAERDIMES